MITNPFRGLLFTEPFADGEDPRAAPTRYCGGDSAPRWTLVRWTQNMGWIYPLGLLFMFFTIGEVEAGDPGPVELGLRIATLVLLGLVYLGTALVADAPLPVRWVWVGLFVALTAATIPYQGWAFTGYGVYVSLMIAALIPWRTARWAMLVWNAIVLLTAIPDRSTALAIVAGIGLVVGWSMGAAFESGRLRRHLKAAEKRVAVLSVEAERERIARDLHDILGHSLTAISIKSGLASRLAEQDPTSAKEQMAEVEQIAREALADVRSTTTGMRQVRLATELASARSVLMAAGVTARTPSAVPAMGERDSELLGYVVREAVTNVVRHAEATQCSINLEDGSVTITDDGVGMSRTTRRGSGLAGLRERVEGAGGTLIIESGSALSESDLEQGPGLVEGPTLRGTVIKVVLSGAKSHRGRPATTESSVSAPSAS